MTATPNNNATEEAQEPSGTLTITAEYAKQSLFKNLGEKEQNIIGRVIYAGMKLLFTPEMNAKVVEGIKRQDEGMDISDKLGIGVGHTLVIMYTESKGTMPLGAMFPAGYVLLAKMYEFVDQTGLAEVTDEDFGESMQMMNAVIEKTFNPKYNGDLVEQGKEAVAQGQQTQDQAAPAAPAQPGLIAQPPAAQPTSGV